MNSIKIHKEHQDALEKAASFFLPEKHQKNLSNSVPKN